LSLSRPQGSGSPALDAADSVRTSWAGMDLAESVAYFRTTSSCRPDRPVLLPTIAAARSTIRNGIPRPQQRSSVCAQAAAPTGKGIVRRPLCEETGPSSHATEQARSPRRRSEVTLPPVRRRSRVLTQSCRTSLPMRPRRVKPIAADNSATAGRDSISSVDPSSSLRSRGRVCDHRALAGADAAEALPFFHCQDQLRD